MERTLASVGLVLFTVSGAVLVISGEAVCGAALIFLAACCSYRLASD